VAEGPAPEEARPLEARPPETRAAEARPPALRASDAERDAAVERLKTGLVEGRLSDEEFDQRMRAALTARTRADLERLLADLPAAASSAAPAVRAQPADRFLLSFKGQLQRRGRWQVPERSTTVAYKGGYHLDLRAAELRAPVTAITVVAYKGEVEIVVPPGVRVELRGMTYGGRWVDDAADEDLPPDAPVLRLRGLAYKGVVHARTIRAQPELPPS
jgi:Domain of unknown function (DUF1707)